MSVTLPTPPDTPDHTLETTPDTTPPAPPGGEQQTFLRPRRAARRDWLRAGFFATLGAALLALLALTAWKFLEATLAVITPFAVGAALALLLDPLVKRLERRGMGRMFATGVVFGGSLVLLGYLLSLAVPALIDQATQLAQNGPRYVQGVHDFGERFLSTHKKIAGVPLPRNVDALTQQVSGRATALIQTLAGHATGFLLGSVTMVIQAIVALIVGFFLLADLDRLRARLFFLLPAQARGKAGQYASDIGGVFSDYLAGLLKVCTLYGLVTIVMLYGLAATPHHHDLAHYALLVGAAAGLLYAVPYVGSTATALVTFLVAFAAGGAGFGGWAILATLVLNQVFDNVVTPRVVGGGVGLHPVVAIFALVLGGEMFGIWGMLLSVPIAASIQVILFRLFPKLTAPTPPAFLRAQGVSPDKKESSKILQGSDSVTAGNQRAQG